MKIPAYYLPLAALFLLTAASCSKSSDPAPAPTAVPQEYMVEYQVSSPTATSADYVAYNDEKNSSITLATTPLPLSYAFKRTMKKGEYLTLSATLPAAPTGTTQTLRTTILLNGKPVKQGETTANAPAAQAIYVIGE